MDDKERRRVYAKKYYLENRQETIDRAIRYRKTIKRKILEYKLLNPCKCGENHPAALDFHHLGEKEFCISDAVKNGYAWNRVEKELAKCKVMCNCHAKFHWNNTFELPDDIELQARIDKRKIKGRIGYWKGKTLSEETKKKMSEAKKGRKFTVEHCKALSKSHRVSNIESEGS